MRRHYLLSYLLLTTFYVSALYARPSADEIGPQDLILPQISTSKKDASFFRKEYPTLESVIQLQDSLARGSKSVAFRAGSSRDLTQYAVGSIPIQESVSPSGARIYNIPIATAQGWDKMHYTHYIAGDQYHNYGTISVHYYQKNVNGVVYKSGFKFKY